MPESVSSGLVRMLDQAYNRKSWHGTNLRGAIRGLSAREAAWRPAAGRSASSMASSSGLVLIVPGPILAPPATAAVAH